MIAFTERVVEVAGVAIALREAGKGEPILVLHGELGPPEPCQWHAALAANFRLVMPIHPGFRGPRTSWIRGVRDLSVLYGFFVRQERLTGCHALGFSLGGWIAAEMAVNNPAQFASLTLVAPFGVKPAKGFIKDMFPISSADYMKAGIANPDATPELATIYGPDVPEKVEKWEDARTEAARIAWQPYMHDLSLPDLLGGLAGLRTTIIRGSEDAIVPEDAVRIYAQRIRGARAESIAGAGHYPEIEAADRFLKIVSQTIGFAPAA